VRRNYKFFDLNELYAKLEKKEPHIWRLQKNNITTVTHKDSKTTALSIDDLVELLLNVFKI